MGGRRGMERTKGLLSPKSIKQHLPDMLPDTKCIAVPGRRAFSQNEEHARTDQLSSDESPETVHGVESIFLEGGGGGRE